MLMILLGSVPIICMPWMPWGHTESRNEKRGIGRGIHGKNLVQDNLCFSYQRDIDCNHCINGFLKKTKSSVIIRTMDCSLRTSVNLLMTHFSPKLKIIPTMYCTNFYQKSNKLDITWRKWHTPTLSPSKMIEILWIEFWVLYKCSVGYTWASVFFLHSDWFLGRKVKSKSKVYYLIPRKDSTFWRSILMRLYSPVDLTGNVNMIEKLVLGGTGTIIALLLYLWIVLYFLMFFHCTTLWFVRCWIIKEYNIYIIYIRRSTYTHPKSLFTFYIGSHMISCLWEYDKNLFMWCFTTKVLVNILRNNIIIIVCHIGISVANDSDSSTFSYLPLCSSTSNYMVFFNNLLTL